MGLAYLPKNGHYLVALLPGFAYLEELGMPGPLMVRLFIGVDKSKLMCPDNMTHAGICRTQWFNVVSWRHLLWHYQLKIDEEHAVPMR